MLRVGHYYSDVQKGDSGQSCKQSEVRASMLLALITLSDALYPLVPCGKKLSRLLREFLSFPSNPVHPGFHNTCKPHATSFYLEVIAKPTAVYLFCGCNGLVLTTVDRKRQQLLRIATFVQMIPPSRVTCGKIFDVFRRFCCNLHLKLKPKG